MNGNTTWTAAPATPHTDRHTIHSYFVTSPESPDGARVLFYCSATPEGHNGDLRIMERASGRETIIAEGIVTEDAHRAACQQWIAGGTEVAYHTLEDGKWKVRVYNLQTEQTSTVAEDRQLGWGQARANLVSLYGLHWDASTSRDFEMLDVENGHLQTVLTAREVREEFPDWVEENYGAWPISIFFPIVSPDLKRVIFKLAAPEGGDWQSWNASTRRGMIGYDFEERRFLFLRKLWGHPAWLPDSRHIINLPGIMIDSNDGSSESILHWPDMKGSHPSPSPDGRHYISDTSLLPDGDERSGIVIGELPDGDSAIAYRFENSGGAQSWRPPHPHPVFSADGNRIYFNAGSTEFTQLKVLERSEAR